MKTIAIIGMGVRGTTYADIIQKNSQLAKIIAVCDPDENKIKSSQLKYNISKDMCFKNDFDFFKQGKLADALLICSNDSSHYNHSMKALDLGYDLLLEKPISSSLDECITIAKKATELNLKVAVCHVLRYCVFTQTLKKILDSGEVGEIININHIERVGYYHQAHSYVRGNWRNENLSSPMILTKCSHDLDLISYFANSQCKSVSSFGGLNYFNKKNKPKNADDFCYKCNENETCIYNCINFYQENENWTKRTGEFFDEFTSANVRKWLSDENNTYARCVFNCDNNVVDNQMVNMEFDNGIRANLTMTAFSSSESRKISFFCTKGEIEGETQTNIVTVKPFGKQPYTIDVNELDGALEAHCGGDKFLIEDFIKQLNNSKTSLKLTSIDKSVHSHIIAFMAEKSRINNGMVINIK